MQAVDVAFNLHYNFSHLVNSVWRGKQKGHSSGGLFGPEGHEKQSLRLSICYTKSKEKWKKWDVTAKNN